MLKIYQSADLIALVVGIASFITAITVISKKIGEIKNNLSQEALKPVLAKINQLGIDIESNTRDTLKLIICNTEIHPQERIKAYDKYKKLGGNSTIDVYVDKKLRPKLKKEYESIG